MVRYYGFYSSVSRGKRKKSDQDDLIPSILEPVEDPDFSGEGSSKEHRKNWARLIQKIYEVDPLTCPKCSGTMKILSFIEDLDVTRLPRLLSALNGMSGGVSRNYAECWNLLGDGNGGQVKKILKHLGLWDIKARPPPKANAP